MNFAEIDQSAALADLGRVEADEQDEHEADHAHEGDQCPRFAVDALVDRPEGADRIGHDRIEDDQRGEEFQNPRLTGALTQRLTDRGPGNRS